jgi:hypothetical protein
MNTPHWRPEDGQLLQSLREKVGLDELVFARTNTVSLAQLRELERGGESSFYNPQIKRNTGVKLLRKLGYEFPAPLPPEPVQALAPLSPDTPEPALDTPAFAQPSLVQGTVPAQTEHGPSFGRRFPGGWSMSPMFWGLSLSVLALLAVLTTTVSKATLSYSSSSPALASALPQTPSKSLAQTVAFNETTPSPASSASLAAASDLPADIIAPSNPTRSGDVACDPQHRETSTVFQQTAPLKPGNYVHFVAQADTTLCVLDHHNKLTHLNLSAGSTKSVYGAAPFLVQSNRWQDLAVFFQGRRVQAVLEGNPHIQLLSQAF